MKIIVTLIVSKIFFENNSFGRKKSIQDLKGKSTQEIIVNGNLNYDIATSGKYVF